MLAGKKSANVCPAVIADQTRLTVNERLTLVIAVLALVISVASTAYTIIRDQRNDSENLLVRATPLRSAGAIRFDGERNLPEYFTLDWEVLFANNGAVTMSIVESQLWIEGRRQESTGGRLVPFRFEPARVYQGLYNQSGQLQKLPIIIEPGHAVRLVIRTRHPVHRDLLALVPVDRRRLSGITLTQLRKIITLGHEDLNEYMSDDYLGLTPMFVTVTTARSKKISTVLAIE